MMQVAIHQIVDMVAMRHRLMATTRPMNVPGFVPATIMARGAIRGILRAHLKRTFIDMPLMRMVQMPVMQIIDMPFVRNRRMAASRAMLVFVIFMYVMCHRVVFPFNTLIGAFSVECANALKINPATC